MAYFKVVTLPSSKQLIQSEYSVIDYAATDDGTLWDVCRHFTTRGHRGPVQCLVASEDVNFIISGGADYTMRVWRYSAEYEAYYLQALLRFRKPNYIVDPVPDQGFLCRVICPKALDWSSQRRGVTAVAVVGSRNTGFKVGESVVLENDADFVQKELDYMDMPWDDIMEEMLGETFEVAEVRDNGVIALPVPEGHESKVLLFPVSCVMQKVQEPPLRDGPIIAGTAHGEVSILCMNSGVDGTVESFGQLHNGAVNSICVLPTGRSRNVFLVITASDDGDCALLQLVCAEGRPMGQEEVMEDDGEADLSETVLSLVEVQEYSINGQPVRLRHRIDDEPTPVLQARNLGENSDPQVATWVTLAKDGAYLWGITGQPLMRLTVQKQTLYYDPFRGHDCLARPDISEYIDLGVVHKENGSLVLVAGGGYTAVWPVEGGIVMLPLFLTLDKTERLELWKKTVAKYKPDGPCPAPVATYHKDGWMIDCDQHPSTTAFAVELDKKAPYRVVLWNLLAIKPEKLVVEPPGPAGLLIMPGREKLLMTLRHSAKVCTLKAVEDVDDSGGGAAILTGLENGNINAWDVDGADARQVYAQLRSLTYWETFLPPILLVVSTIQIMSFAFGPQIPWRKTVHEPAQQVHRIMMLEFEFKLRIDKEMLFWLKSGLTLGLIVVFILTAATGAIFLLDEAAHKLQDTRCFKWERRQALGPCHFILKIMRLMRSWMCLAIQICSTILVAPMFQACATAVACRSPSDGSPGVLMFLPALECNEGWLPKLRIAIFILLPMYFFVLIPFATVSGDPFYVPRSTLYDFQIWLPENMWKKAARRKASDMYLGFLHRTPDQAFETLFAELIAKCILPVATTELALHPVIQMVIVSIVGTAMWAQCVMFPPFLEAKFTVLVQDLKFMTMISMQIGLLVVLLGYAGIHEAIIPVILLVVFVILTLCHLVYKLWTIPLKRHQVRQYISRVRVVELEQPDAEEYANCAEEDGDEV